MARRTVVVAWKAKFNAWLAPFLTCLPRGVHGRSAPRDLEALPGQMARQ